MKKIFAVALLSVFVWACNSHRNSENKEAVSPAETGHQHQAKAEGPGLNSGAKWKADSNTNNNIKTLLAIVEKFSNGTDRSMTAYSNAAVELQSGLDKMVRECKMKGPDHDALHKWLEPLIKQVKELKQATTVKEAEGLPEKIHAQLNHYPKYFE